jgi:dihydrofolate reductase
MAAKLVVGTFLTLDGVMQAPGGPEEDREGGFEHGGWLAPHFDEMMGQIMTEEFRRATGFLLGRKTYDIFAGYWPNQPDDDGIATGLNTKPKWVPSRTLSSADWHNTTVIKGNAAEEIARIKQQHAGEINVPGSSNLIQTLLKHDLIDEFHLWTFPVVLGTGKRLFDDGTIPIGLKLTRSELSTTGVLFHVHERAGAVEHGTVGA